VTGGRQEWPRRNGVELRSARAVTATHHRRRGASTDDSSATVHVAIFANQ